MNKLKYFIPAILLAFFIAGCGTITPKKAAYNTLATIGSAVDTSMKTLASEYKKGRIREADWKMIRDMRDNKFGPMFEKAILAVKADLTTMPPEDVKQTASEIIDLIYELTK